MTFGGQPGTGSVHDPPNGRGQPCHDVRLEQRRDRPDGSVFEERRQLRRSRHAGPPRRQHNCAQLGPNEAPSSTPDLGRPGLTKMLSMPRWSSLTGTTSAVLLELPRGLVGWPRERGQVPVGWSMQGMAPSWTPGVARALLRNRVPSTTSSSPGFLSVTPTSVPLPAGPLWDDYVAAAQAARH